MGAGVWSCKSFDNYSSPRTQACLSTLGCPQTWRRPGLKVQRIQRRGKVGEESQAYLDLVPGNLSCKAILVIVSPELMRAGLSFCRHFLVLVLGSDSVDKTIGILPGYPCINNTSLLKRVYALMMESCLAGRCSPTLDAVLKCLAQRPFGLVKSRF